MNEYTFDFTQEDGSLLTVSGATIWAVHNDVEFRIGFLSHDGAPWEVRFKSEPNMDSYIVDMVECCEEGMIQMPAPCVILKVAA